MRSAVEHGAALRTEQAGPAGRVTALGHWSRSASGSQELEVQADRSDGDHLVRYIGWDGLDRPSAQVEHRSGRPDNRPEPEAHRALVHSKGTPATWCRMMRGAERLGNGRLVPGPNMLQHLKLRRELGAIA